jgi:hypothetical protein
VTASTITIDLLDPDVDDGPVDVWHRGGVLRFDHETDALAFVARRQAERPSTTVKVRLR